jgi:hypothetical protein
MKRAMRFQTAWCVSIISGLLTLWPLVATAREAAFVEPGTAVGKNGGTDALVADPKIFDAGDSTVGITRRVSLFFVNTSGVPLELAEMTTTGDGNVTVLNEASDCKPAEKIPANSRCSMALAITPTSPGNWSVEILARHNGAGRIARATVNGKAAVDAKTSARAEGLNLSSRDMKPVEFGDVDTAGAPAVRTALMVNDSPQSITIKAIDLIAVDQGLERLLAGCAVDQVLEPDASCPITLKWQPNHMGSIATDLIMRHTGKIGFTVIPVRGRGIGGGSASMTSLGTEGGMSASVMNSVSHSGSGGKVAPPPTAMDVESVTGKLPTTVTSPPPVAASANLSATTNNSGGKLYLIGVVGRRAIVQREGVTRSLDVGNELELGGATIKLLSVTERDARVLVNNQPRLLKLAASGYRPVPAKSEKTANTGEAITDNAAATSPAPVAAK